MVLHGRSRLARYPGFETTAEDAVELIDLAGRMQAAGARSKREAVELGLRTLVQLSQQAEIRNFRGKLPWQGSLNIDRLDSPTTPRS